MSDKTPTPPAAAPAAAPEPKPAAASKPAAAPAPLIRKDPEAILTTSSSPHIHSGASVPRIMRDVVISLAPCTLAAIHFFGWRALLLVVVCIAVSVGTEWLCRRLMKRDNTIHDFSAVVTGLLLALTLPVGLPLWQAILGSVFAIAIAKQLYGGLGYNPFNPALAARAFMLVSFTATMTAWTPSAWLAESKDNPFSGPKLEKAEAAADATTTATPLGIVKEGTKSNVKACETFEYTPEVRRRLFFGNVNGSIGETSALAILIGFAYLLFRRVITWHITVSYLGAMAVFALALQRFAPLVAMPVDFHLLAGGALFGAVFMATDMVTTPITRWGHVVFGIGCGLLTMIIRVVPGGSYPEGVTFAILIMCALTPLINRATRYQRWGVGRRANVRKAAP
ncbi:MAG: RnfABCDGE type electron transport complex subunit D [Kiritimatiellia bacterium]